MAAGGAVSGSMNERSFSRCDASRLRHLQIRSRRRSAPALYDALAARLAEAGVALQPVECLSVCKRPCTVALAAPGKWTYVVGDLNRDDHIDDIVTAAPRYAATPDGLVPWRERPLPFRKGVISRTPPLSPSLSEA